MERRMNCQFCQQDIKSSPIEEAIRMGADRYWCDKCQAEYLMFRHEDEPNSVSLYVSLNDKNYRWTATRTGRGLLFHVGEMFNPQHLSHDCEVLFSLSPEDHKPNITPDNVVEKIKTMLIFL
jgi:hypothetical protein